ncbi:PLAC8-domain-containing protein [Morchella conica CCBAS932]|uniref:PLAC8-domain-containing protein n=1 Tax=Morchella conica CCBAS932 TaxID=1392247 RepID=A0A3N4KYZ6_9PEZI|nr:PLAC8-domain-containing protein [Morchella conica CCBAS932]
MEGPKTPLYTPGGGSGPNGGTHAPGQIGHPNQQIGKDEYQHGLCDCFGDIPTCCIGCWCPCILYSRTNHRLKTIPNSNLNDFHHCNTHCVGCCVLAPVSWIFTFLQRGRIRDKYHLEGTLMSDCGKAYCCVMCTLVQDEREVSDREDERRRNAGPGSGVVGETGYMRQSNMIYG